MGEKKLATLQAEPEPLDLDLKRLAVMVIDMQNAFVSKGGMFDLWGMDISGVPKAIEPIKKIVETARAVGIRMIYVAHTLYPDVREVGPMSAFWHKRVMKSFREKPEMRDSILLRGTWGAEIIDELKPREDDILIEKRRYSAFVGTDLDTLLRSYDIKYLAFTGVATNVCVESSLRDAYHLEYLPILISDAAAACPMTRHDATIATVIQAFGWVTDTERFLKAMT